MYKQMGDVNVVKMVQALQNGVNDRETTLEVKAGCKTALDMLGACAKGREYIKSTTMEVLPRYSFPMVEAYLWIPNVDGLTTIYNAGVDVSTVAKFCDWFYNLSVHRKAYVCDQMHDNVEYQMTYVWTSYSKTLQADFPPNEPVVNGALHIKGVEAMYMGEIAGDYCFSPISHFEVENVMTFATKEAVMMGMVFGRLESFLLYPEECFIGSTHMQRFDCRVKFGDSVWVRHRPDGIPFSKEVNALVFEIPVTEENSLSMKGVYCPSVLDKRAILAQPADSSYRCFEMQCRSRCGWDFPAQLASKADCYCSDKTHGPPMNAFNASLITDLNPAELDLNFNDGLYIADF
jgi:hypothetical protein